LRSVAAKTPEDGEKLKKELKATRSKFAARFLELAEKNAKESVALDALLWVCNNTPPHRGFAAERAKAMDLLIRDHIQSNKLGPVCQSLASGFDTKRSETLLRAILAKNPHKSVQAEASLALAEMLNTRLDFAKRIKDDPAFLEAFPGMEVADELRNEDLAALATAAEKAYTEFAEKYSADVPAERLTWACMRLSSAEGKAADRFLRALEKDKRRAVQGVACLTLGQVLKRRADVLFEKDAKTAAKLRKESEELLARAAERYGDVKLMPERFGAVVGDKAKNELFELRHLSTGLTAPEISGEDQDGKQMKLSDYKGKVVLLDFWSEF
jgi:AhpC/TSA family